MILIYLFMQYLTLFNKNKIILDDAYYDSSILKNKIKNLKL